MLKQGKILAFLRGPVEEEKKMMIENEFYDLRERRNHFIPAKAAWGDTEDPVCFWRKMVRSYKIRIYSPTNFMLFRLVPVPMLVLLPVAFSKPP